MSLTILADPTPTLPLEGKTNKSHIIINLNFTRQSRVRFILKLNTRESCLEVFFINYNSVSAAR